MSKPWEQEWSIHATHANWVVVPSFFAEDGKIVGTFSAMGDRASTEAARAKLASAAPDMARAGLRAVEGVIRDTGLDDVDSVVQRGEPVRLTAEEFGALVDALRKAGAL